MTSGGKNCTSN